MCKWQRVIPGHKGSPHYRIAHGWKDEFGSFNLEALKFLMHFRELGVHFYFIFTSYLLIFFLFFSFSHTHIFVLSLFFSFFSFFLLIKIFLFAPLEL
jgi:hypothetical protein